jgi:alkaline phosphatase
MNRFYRLSAFIIVSIILSGSLHCYAGKIQIPEKKTRNIVLFIGDGMGVAQVYAAMTRSDHTLALERFPYSGFSKTYSFDDYITDSGAGATAIACGIKTRVGMIGMGPDSVAVKSIVEIAHKNGLATGVVVTCCVTHATPAAFVAHNPDRADYEDIAKDFLNGSIDLFIGGGENHFRKRKDGRDLCNDLKEQGFDVVYNIGDMNKSNSGKLAALLAKSDMPKASEGREGMLKAMTKKALEVLRKDKNGFFLMVEGSAIDWACAGHNINYAISETIDLDDAIGVAKEFADENGETLIIVTADHETGGLTLTGGSITGHKVEAKFAAEDHTAVMVPIFSYGPGAEKFSGIHENTFFLDEFLNLLNIKK